ncbi:MAG: heme-binding protein [Mycobacterium sp.]
MCVGNMDGRGALPHRPTRQREDGGVLDRLRTVAGQLVESALSIVGIRAGIEEPSHSAEPLIDGVEIRRYGPRIAAETVVNADEQTARNAGFRRLAGYIFGANHSDTTIAMTTPVGQLRDRGHGQRIAMTAPVAQSADSGNGWVIRFYMPGKWTMETLPTPNDERVHLVTAPPETFAVLRFRGDRGPSAVAAQTARLRKTLLATGFAAVDDAIAWFYDPPWTLPFRRRNEIAIPVTQQVPAPS